MFTKIQKYLLLNYPLLWNLRIVPVLICTLLINLFFYGAGYLATELDFKETSLYYSLGNWPIYFGAVVTSILSFIFWMIFYAKNNAFKVFYPKTSGSLYLEWLLSFVIVLSMVMYPYSFMKGGDSKLRTYSSEAEMVNAIETLKMIHILIPQSKNEYYKEYPDAENSAYETKTGEVIVSGMEEAQPKDTLFENYPDFAQLSLLNYNRYGFYIPNDHFLDIRDSDTVKKWLVEENKEEISNLMDSFFKLLNKHSLTTNLTKEKWMELVYNPRKYPVGDFNLIARYNYMAEDNDYYTYRNFDPENSSGYYVPYNELISAYLKIEDAYLDYNNNELALLWIFILSLSISILVFSFKATSGKSWLIAAVSLGLLLMLDWFVSLVTHIVFDGNIFGPVLYIILLLGILISGFIYVISKLAQSRRKGRSHIIMNVLMWSVPAIPALLLVLTYIFSKDLCDYRDECWTDYVDDHIMQFVWGNIALTFLTMGLFIRFVLLKWKSLPDD